MATCTLRIGDRVALASVGGAPEVEYALFDPGAIELAANGPGMVQEVGYVTSAGEAIERLEEGGITAKLVLETAAALQPTVATIYARGPSIRRIAMSLGPAELFDGCRYDATTKLYEGRWLDLPALALDAEIPRLTQTLQTMHLHTLLAEVGADEPVQLITRDHMANSRPGGRSYRRYTFAAASALPATLRTFAERLRASPTTPRPDRSVGPTAAELLDILRDRIVLLSNAEHQDRLRAIERAVGIRQRPLRGPLADPETWALEDQLSSGRSEGVVELVDALEKSKGKQPATAYLRARAALVAGREAPKAIAERIAALALSMPSFVELELLAIEAWNAAGEPKRGLPFVRDLVANASVNDELRVRESQELAMKRPSQPDEPATAPRKPTPAPPDVVPEARGSAPSTVSLLPPEAAASRTPAPPLEHESHRRPTQPLIAVDPDQPPSLRPRPSAPPPPPSARLVPASSRKNTPPMVFGIPDPARPPTPPSVPTTRSQGLLQKRTISGTWVGPAPTKPGGPARPTEMHFGAVPPPPSSEGSRVPATSRTPLPPPPPPSDGRVTGRPAPDAPRLANASAAELMRGASQPPFRSDSPDAHVNVPKAPPVPHFDGGAEVAATLSLPSGLEGAPEPVETLPRTVLDARIQFTFLSRELGQEYEDRLGLTLRADIGGVEMMQRVLLERYGSRAVSTPEAAVDVRRHGAFLSEILARSFGAFWVDIGPNDVGYWAMVVPPGTRVWPFGRILRLIAMQHNERDIVSYFLELQGRATRGS